MKRVVLVLGAALGLAGCGGGRPAYRATRPPLPHEITKLTPTELASIQASMAAGQTSRAAYAAAADAEAAFLAEARARCDHQNRMYQATTPSYGFFGGLEVVASGNRAARTCVDEAMRRGQLPG